jgi:hypothetical protein
LSFLFVRGSDQFDAAGLTRPCPGADAPSVDQQKDIGSTPDVEA